jgi:DNA-binding cell septation regulator SpoVG
MSFNINDSSKIAKDKSVICDYYDCSIYFNQYERTPLNGGSIKIPFFTPENIVRPNGMYISSGPTLKYRSNTLHIYKKTHIIDGIDYDGELVIENKRITNGDSKMFICFPLKTANNVNANEIDKIIKKSENTSKGELKMTVNLNSMFNKLQKYIFYKNGNDIVVVFTEPIKVDSVFDKFKKCDLFSAYDDNYNILQNVTAKDGFQSMTEGFVEGLSSGEMDCQPIDITTNKPVNGLPTLSYLNSGNDAQNKTINLLFSMIMFVIVFSISFFGVPPFYKEVFINKLNDETLTYTTIFCIFYLAWIIGMIAGGMMYDVRAAITGIMFLILLGISALTIIGRTYYDTAYFPGVKFAFDMKMFFEHVKVFALLYIADIKKFLKFENSPYKYGYGFTLFSIIVTLVLFIVIATTSKKNKSKTNSGKSKKDKKLKGYLDYAYSMLGIFGFGYGIFVLGPFVGYITQS